MHYLRCYDHLVNENFFYPIKYKVYTCRILFDPNFFDCLSISNFIQFKFNVILCKQIYKLDVISQVSAHYTWHNDTVYLAIYGVNFKTST